MLTFKVYFIFIFNLYQQHTGIIMYNNYLKLLGVVTFVVFSFSTLGFTPIAQAAKRNNAPTHQELSRIIQENPKAIIKDKSFQDALLTYYEQNLLTFEATKLASLIPELKERAKVDAKALWLLIATEIGQDNQVSDSTLNLIDKLKEKNDAASQTLLAICYQKGFIFEQDEAKAIALYLKAAQQGHIKAQALRGPMYINGRGVKKNEVEAAKWWRAAAEQGDAEAQYNLGVMYDQGQGVKKNATEAVKWYRLAAEQGYADAQCNLGIMYYQGQGVKKSKAEAAKWWRAAAEQGHALAQDNLRVISGTTR